MKKYNILFSLVFFIFVSCSEEKEPEGSISFFYNVGIAISLQDSIGNNLIDTEGYDSSKFRIYWKKNGNLEMFYDFFSDNPYGYAIGMMDGRPRCGITLNDDTTVEISETYIKWNETDIDTIATTIQRTPYRVIPDKIWYNRALVWDDETMGNTERHIIVVKK